jgi:uncharacterized protein (TIGR00255 family)
MTGYGKFTAEQNNRILTIEIKTVNNRFLDVSPRLPKALAFCEDAVRNEIKKRLSRGSVDVYFDYVDNSDNGNEVVFDDALARSLVSSARKAAQEFGLDYNFNVAELMRYPDVVTVKGGSGDEDEISELVLAAIVGALDKLESMRLKEGASVKADFEKLVGNIESYLNRAKERAPKVVEDYRAKIDERIREFLGDVEVDEAKLLNEVAFFADKADVNEEIQRLSSHIVQFYEILSSSEPQGRKLDFLSQEMNREINTMGSKSNDKELTSYVLAMKNELEKIKEQIRNVE